MAQPRETAPKRPVEDPQLGRMFATHIHCGETMKLVPADQVRFGGLPDGKNGGSLLTYRCACGFSFDQRQE